MRLMHTVHEHLTGSGVLPRTYMYTVSFSCISLARHVLPFFMWRKNTCGCVHGKIFILDTLITNCRSWLIKAHGGDLFFELDVIHP